MVVRASWLFGTAVRNFVETMLRLAASSRRSSWSPIRSASHLHPASGGGARRADRERPVRDPPRRGRGEMLLVRLRAGDLRPGDLECRVMAGDDRMLGRPAPRPAYSVLGAERHGAPVLPEWRDGLPPVPRERAALAHESDDPRHRRRRLHRLQRTSVTASRTHPGDEVRVLDKLTYAGRRENLEGLERLRARRRRHRRRRRRRAARSRAATRSSTSPPSPTSTARSSRPASSSRPTSSAPSCCSRRRATPGIRHLQISTDEVYGSIEEGSFTESSPLDPSSPYSASKAGGDLLVARISAPTAPSR